MNEEELEFETEKLKSKLFSDLHILRAKYVKENSEFKIGDFIQNTTGIIRVSNISYVSYGGNLDTHTNIVYYGYRYKKIKGELSRTKDKTICNLTYELKLTKYETVRDIKTLLTEKK